MQKKGFYVGIRAFYFSETGTYWSHKSRNAAKHKMSQYF